MMNSKQLIDLPEVFVSFEIEKIEGCHVVYLNEGLAAGQSSADILESYSYVVRTDPKSVSDRARVKTFMAERYGGDGIARNGGGGRCGFDGVWQLKGLGPNQLVDPNVDICNRDGNQCLQTALNESIWAEIVHVALPYGAIHTVAILNTGLTYEKYGQAKTRGLIVREPVVRPAHFIRAIYFKQKHIDTLGEDAQRVKAAIRKLVDFLPGRNSTSMSLSQPERLERGLLELAGRYAEQFAAARAKHISHNNVSESNIALNGAWLDLSGARLFTHTVSGDRLNIERFNAEYAHAIHSLESLCYYLSKYSVLTTEASAEIFQTVIKHFTQQYHKHLSLYEVAQAGFPLWVLELLTDRVEFAEFSKHVRALLDRDDFTVRAVKLEGGWEGYERWTGPLYLGLLAAKVNATPLADLTGITMAVGQAVQLSSGFNQLFEAACAVANKHGISQQNFCRCMAINAVRLNRSHLVLHELEARIKKLELSALRDEALGCQALVDEAVRAARLNLGSEQGLAVPFWLSNKLSIEFEPVSGMFVTDVDVRPTFSIDALFEPGVNHSDVNGALQFYREAWSIFNET